MTGSFCTGLGNYSIRFTARVVGLGQFQAYDSGLLSNQGEKSINFYFILVPLRKSIKVWYSKAQDRGWGSRDTKRFTIKAWGLRLQWGFEWLRFRVTQGSTEWVRGPSLLLLFRITIQFTKGRVFDQRQTRRSC